MSEIKVDGVPQTYGDGATRHSKDGKGRFDLIPPEPFEKIAAAVDELTVGPIVCEPTHIYDLALNGYYAGAIVLMTAHEYGGKHSTLNEYDKYESTYDDMYYGIFSMLQELAKHFENGAKIYGERNCQKGIPEESFRDSGLRHLAQYFDGQEDEPHFIAAIWNFWMLMWTQSQKKLDDTRVKVRVSRGSRNIPSGAKSNQFEDVRDNSDAVEKSEQKCSEDIRYALMKRFLDNVTKSTKEYLYTQMMDTTTECSKACSDSTKSTELEETKSEKKKKPPKHDHGANCTCSGCKACDMANDVMMGDTKSPCLCPTSSEMSYGFVTSLIESIWFAYTHARVKDRGRAVDDLCAMLHPGSDITHLFCSLYGVAAFYAVYNHSECSDKSDIRRDPVFDDLHTDITKFLFLIRHLTEEFYGCGMYSGDEVAEYLKVFKASQKKWKEPSHHLVEKTLIKLAQIVAMFNNRCCDPIAEDISVLAQNISINVRKVYELDKDSSNDSSEG